MTIKDVIDYVDRVKKNEFTTEEKTRWINEIEGYVQIQIMLLAQPECISYCYSSESEQSGISFPADNQMRLPRKLKAHVGGFLKIEGLVTYPENNLSGLEILSISDNGKLIEFEQGTFPQTGETPESAIAQIAFDGQDTELLVPAPFERLYYEYVLAKISENLEENSAQNNRLATFDETWQNFAEWYANTYRPGDGKAIFKGYYITGKQGVPGSVGPRGENLYNVGLSTSTDGITADKTYDELVEQLEAGIMVVPIVDGVAFVSNAVKNDNTIVFTAADDSVSPVLKGYSVNSSNVWTKFTKLLPTEAQLNSKYTKPASGIPKTDLASYVQASLDKADTALQEHQSLTAYRTSADQDVIDGSKQDKLIAGKNIKIAEDGKTISAAGKANVIGCFEVTLTKQADGSYTSSKTYAQVKEEIANNNCFMLIDGYNCVFVLTRIGGVTVEFAGMLDGTDGWMRVEVSSDERWEVIPEPRITLDWYNGLVEDIGKLRNLTTTDKSNLVAAINEVKGITDNKQAKLIAGENITIAADGKTISATGGGGSTIELDTTLSETGKAADAKAVGDALADKQDTISDLVNIRSGAAKGATALQAVPSTYRTASAQDVVDNGLDDRISAIEGKEAGWDGKYVKPTNGIPKTDLANGVQASLSKADSALQSHQSLAAYRTASAQDAIDSGKVDKVSGKGLSSNDYTDAAKAKVDAIPANPQYTDTVFSGSYNDLTDKPTIPAPVTEQTVSGWGFTKNTGTYSKPTDGIPKADLANDVQASLVKAETALQEHQSLTAYRTAAAQDNIDITKQDKLIAGENITIAEDGKTISATGGGGVLPVTLTLGAPIQQGNSIGWFYTADQGRYEIKDAIDAGITVLKCSLIYEDNPNEVAKVLYLNFSSMNSDAIFVGFDLPGVYYELSFPISGAGEGMLSYITLPTKTSELENDSGYLTLATLPKYEGVVE